jgi:hypothetical protein
MPTTRPFITHNETQKPQWVNKRTFNFISGQRNDLFLLNEEHISYENSIYNSYTNLLNLLESIAQEPVSEETTNRIKATLKLFRANFESKLSPKSYPTKR